MRSAVSVLGETDGESLEHAVDVVHKLPIVAYCGNLEALAAEIPPPEDERVAARVEEARAELSRVSALENAGRYPAAQELLADIAGRAQELPYEPLRAELALVAGRLDIHQGKAEHAIERLRTSVAAGLASGANVIALEAWARYIYALGTSSEQSPEQSSERQSDALASLFAAEALARRVPDSTFVHALLLNNAGVVSLAARERDRARSYFEQAQAVKSAAAGESDSELTAISFNLAMVTTHPGRRAALMGRASDELMQALGAVHPRTLGTRLVQGYYTDDPLRVRRLLDGTCADYSTYHPQNYQEITDCYYYLGFLYAESGQRARAADLSTLAAARPPKKWQGGIARGFAALYHDQPQAALDAIDGALPGLLEDARHWWNKKHVAAAHLARGLSLVALNRPAQAREELAQAHDLFVEVAGMNDTGGGGRSLVSANWRSARALSARSRSLARGARRGGTKNRE